MKNFYWWVSIGAMWASLLLNIILSRRSWRMIRQNREMRLVIWSYEKELRERGVTLPARCTFCCQVLPRHVDGCAMNIPQQIRLTFKKEL